MRQSGCEVEYSEPVALSQHPSSIGGSPPSGVARLALRPVTWAPPTPEERRAYWDERFGADRTVFGGSPNRFVAEHLAGLPPGLVLDLGAGQGRNAVWLAGWGHRVTAVDLSPVAGDQTREAASPPGSTSRWSPPT